MYQQVTNYLVLPRTPFGYSRVLSIRKTLWLPGDSFSVHSYLASDIRKHVSQIPFAMASITSWDFAVRVVRLVQAIFAIIIFGLSLTCLLVPQLLT